MRESFLVAVLVLALLPSALSAQSRNVVLIVSDGVRWQDIFTGADSTYITRTGGGAQDTAALRRDFWRPTADERRRALLPFLWAEAGGHGTIWGNRALGSEASVTNGLKFSYPGYNELLTGAADPRVNSNSYGPNPNVTVFEWLARRPGFAGRVAAFGSWDAFDRIFNKNRAGFLVHSAFAPLPDAKAGIERPIDRLYRTTTRPWDNTMSFDAFMMAVVVDYVKRHKPRVLYLGFGETDEWAHEKRYDLVMRSLHDVDGYVAELWRLMQSMPEYRGNTTFIVTTDHGRGDGAKWTDHGRDVDNAEHIWMAMFGAGAPKLGEVRNAERVTQSQVAATVAAVLGEDYRAARPHVAAALVPVRPRR
ncbi:MAG: alkaline phosphatase family protein [Gemmatimonadetes bacterium]|nr:alkaline phosphatase family protein [Gemmatimonadota bacterium]